MARKFGSQHLLTAVFTVFLLGLVFIVFAPTMTAAATSKGETNIPLILAWALPVLAITAVILIYSHKSICASAVKQ